MRPSSEICIAISFQRRPLVERDPSEFVVARGGAVRRALLHFAVYLRSAAGSWRHPTGPHSACCAGRHRTCPRRPRASSSRLRMLEASDRPPALAKCIMRARAVLAETALIHTPFLQWAVYSSTRQQAQPCRIVSGLLLTKDRFFLEGTVLRALPIAAMEDRSLRRQGLSLVGVGGLWPDANGYGGTSNPKTDGPSALVSGGTGRRRARRQLRLHPHALCDQVEAHWRIIDRYPLWLEFVTV